MKRNTPYGHFERTIDYTQPTMQELEKKARAIYLAVRQQFPDRYPRHWSAMSSAEKDPWLNVARSSRKDFD